jgi:hypothetical protein
MSETKGNILLAITDWDPEIWLKTFRDHAPDRPVVTDRAENDPSSHIWRLCGNKSPVRLRTCPI